VTPEWVAESVCVVAWGLVFGRIHFVMTMFDDNNLVGLVGLTRVLRGVWDVIG